MQRLSRRKLLAGGGAAAGGLPLLHSLVPHAGVHAGLGNGPATASARGHLGTGHGGGTAGPTFRAGADRRPPRQRLQPDRSAARLRLGASAATGRAVERCGNGSSWRATRRSRWRPASSSPAWVYNGRVPGPTLRCREGERLRIRFVNGSAHPHTIHFHGIHPADMDGVPGAGPGLIQPGAGTTYEFDAEPFGLHLYHCHVGPLAEHIARGMYGTFIVDPQPRPPGG